MQELRFVRRDNQTVIVADETDTEYSLVLDDALLSELRHLQRQHSTAPRLNPRIIQTMLREGRSLQEVAQKVGASPEDIERYAEPVFAEIRFILDRAGAVPVRTEQNAGETETFREVIDQRLRSVLATEIEWGAFRDEEGWHIVLDFHSHEADHHAVWNYDHKKNVLVAANTDAINLSQQGDVGDRLIPRLRPVQPVAQPVVPAAAIATEEAASAPEAENNEAAEAASQQDAAVSAVEEALVAEPAGGIESEEEYLRKQEIAHWAVKTADEPQDFSQTADLLDALRKRRGERESAAEENSAKEPADTLLLPQVPPTQHANVPGTEVSDEALLEFDEVEDAAPQQPTLHAVPRPQEGEKDAPGAANSEAAASTPAAENDEKPRGKKGRASIPKWEDILFGTRSEEDPA